MTEETYLLFAFESTHAAIAAQRALADFGVTVMPTLREITASCGMSLRLAVSDGTEAAARLRARRIGSWTLYRVTQNGKEVSCTKVTK